MGRAGTGWVGWVSLSMQHMCCCCRNAGGCKHKSQLLQLGISPGHPSQLSRCIQCALPRAMRTSSHAMPAGHALHIMMAPSYRAAPQALSNTQIKPPWPRLDPAGAGSL